MTTKLAGCEMRPPYSTQLVGEAGLGDSQHQSMRIKEFSKFVNYSSLARARSSPGLSKQLSCSGFLRASWGPCSVVKYV